MQSKDFAVQMKTVQALSFVLIEFIYSFFCRTMDRINEMSNHCPEVASELMETYYYFFN